MVASEDEFLSHKDRIVEDVQDKLRHLARIEAELLFREFNANGREIALPQISNRISQAIIRTHDAIYNMLEQEDQSTGLLADNSDTTRSLLMNHLHNNYLLQPFSLVALAPSLQLILNVVVYLLLMTSQPLPLKHLQ